MSDTTLIAHSGLSIFPGSYVAPLMLDLLLGNLVQTTFGQRRIVTALLVGKEVDLHPSGLEVHDLHAKGFELETQRAREHIERGFDDVVCPKERVGHNAQTRRVVHNDGVAGGSKDAMAPYVQFSR